MPFTLSHPAAVLPLRRWLPFAPLAIGAMAPDFPYFVGLGEVRFRTHTLASVATFSLPVGLAAYFVFARWLRAAWCDLLPRGLAQRAPRRCPRTGALAIAAAVALGALTHVIWDSFTHEHQPGVRLLTVLNVVVVELLGFPLRGYNLLQHGSTLAGLALLGWTLRRWLASTPARELPASWRRAATPRRAAPLLVCGVLAPLALAIGFRSFPPGTDLVALRSFVGASVVAGMSLTLAALFAYTVWWHLRAADGSRTEMGDAERS